MCALSEKHFPDRPRTALIGAMPARGKTLIAVLAFAGACLVSGPALAGCTDAAAPGVDWSRCYLDGKDLRNVDLTGAWLRSASFNRADLSDSNLSEVDGFRAKFVSAMATNARFDGARLEKADLTKADLSGASFADANLRHARFFRANLRGADLTGARMRGADLLNADLSGATWTDGEKVCAEGSIGQCN
jgi:uncharacterized protein YjbI with pentapeptide repeats